MTFLHYTFPLFTNDNISRILEYYPSTNASVSPNTPKFATSGTSLPTALNESTFGTGQQQRADVSLQYCPLCLPTTHSSLPIPLTPPNETERLRRINVRVPILLARRRLHKHQPNPQSLQIPILCHRRRAQLRRLLLRGSPDPQPSPRLQQSLHGHLGQLHHDR